jgi:hypothetical protein
MFFAILPAYPQTKNAGFARQIVLIWFVVEAMMPAAGTAAEITAFFVSVQATNSGLLAAWTTVTAIM